MCGFVMFLGSSFSGSGAGCDERTFEWNGVGIDSVGTPVTHKVPVADDISTEYGDAEFCSHGGLAN